MKEKRAEEIGEKLNDTERWHIHGRRIPAQREIRWTLEFVES
jgi:hypothetical protein